MCSHAAANGPENVEERTLEEAADAAEVEQRRREQHDRRLDDDVAVANVRELVREHALDLGGRQGEQADGERDRRRPHAASRARPSGGPLSITYRRGFTTRAGGESSDQRVEVGILAFRQLARRACP